MFYVLRSFAAGNGANRTAILAKQCSSRHSQGVFGGALRGRFSAYGLPSLAQRDSPTRLDRCVNESVAWKRKGGNLSKFDFTLPSKFLLGYSLTPSSISMIAVAVSKQRLGCHIFDLIGVLERNFTCIRLCCIELKLSYHPF